MRIATLMLIATFATACGGADPQPSATPRGALVPVDVPTARQETAMLRAQVVFLLNGWCEQTWDGTALWVVASDQRELNCNLHMRSQAEVHYTQHPDGRIVLDNIEVTFPR